MWVMPQHLHINQNSDYDDDIFPGCIYDYIPGKESSAQLRFFRHISPFKNRTEIINLSQEF